MGPKEVPVVSMGHLVLTTEFRSHSRLLPASEGQLDKAVNSAHNGGRWPDG